MKNLVVAVLGVLLLIGLGYVGKRLLWPERLDGKISGNLNVDLSLRGVNLSQGRDGKKLWSLNASGANYAEAQDELALDKPCVTYWGENATDAMLVCAPKGLVWQKQDRAKMWDGVHATKKDYTLLSEDLLYTGSAKTLVLTGDVRVTGTSMRARSDELVYFVDSGNFTATGNVAVTLN